MATSNNIKIDQAYWENRYIAQTNTWDLKEVSPPLKVYIDQLAKKDIAILIPGCGNAHEANYLLQKGFTNITIVDIALPLVEQLQEAFKNTIIKVIHQDVFLHHGKYDLIIEQTLFCALEPSLRLKYVKKLNKLLNPNGKLVGLLFNTTFQKEGPPFGGSIQEYETLFSPHFYFKTFEPCYNSIAPRSGTEMFINFEKNNIIPSTDPLHGVTLEKMLTYLVATFGWEDLGSIVNIKCFNVKPSIKSSLVFLRKTPWARAKVEELYVGSL